jgi:hypothetical protein
MTIRDVIYIALLAIPAVAPGLVPMSVTPALASSAGDACRKDICDTAVAMCMRADLTLNPLAGTEAEKKVYCAQFSTGCMTRSIAPELPWYSPETVARFLKCPS